MRTAVVTGANRGLGLEFVRQLAARGDHVVAGARDPQTADELAAVAGSSGGRVTVFGLDAADPSSIGAAAAHVAGRWPSVDLLVNNAGIMRAPDAPEAASAGPLGKLDGRAMLEVLRVNAIGPALVTQALRPQLTAAGRAVVVNLSSRMGSLAHTNSSADYAYSMSKAALNMLTRNLAAELADDGTVVIAVSPGWVRTDMGGPGAPLEPPESIKGILSFVDGLDLGTSGRFFDHTGSQLPW